MNVDMSLLVTGSIGIDTIKTPFGVSENCLGGSSVYFSMAASLFTPVRFVGVVGADCPFDLARVFAGRNVDLTGLEVRSQSRTFRWTGLYHSNMDDRTTECMELNVLKRRRRYLKPSVTANLSFSPIRRQPFSLNCSSRSRSQFSWPPIR